MEVNTKTLEALLTQEEAEFEKNRNLIFVKPGNIVETEKGFFIVIEEGKNNTKTVVPIIPTSSFASKGDYIFIAPAEIFPIADRWTVLCDYKITLPYGMIKYGYLHGCVSADFVEAIKLKQNIERSPELKHVLDRWLENYLKISEFITQKNSVWLQTKTASDRISKFENGVFITIEPDLIEIVSTQRNSLIELYINDVLMDVVYYEDTPIKISMDHIDPLDFENSLKVVASTAI